VASRIVDERPSVGIYGGTNGDGSTTAPNGYFYYGNNEGKRLVDPLLQHIRIVDDNTLRAFGTRGANPYVQSATGAAVDTPFISAQFGDGTTLFEGGAERYGVVSTAVVQEVSPFVQALRDAAPSGGSAALARRSSFAGLVMEGFDALIMVNLTGRSLLDPKLVGFGDAGFSQMSALLAGGWAQDAAFGGDGADTILALQANGMYLTFVPSDTASNSLRFGFSVDGASTSGVLTRDGQAMYLSTVAIPEPGTWAMLLAGLGVLLRRFRVRRAAGELAHTARS